MPLHKGHLALIDFASRQCDQLFILLCYTKNEVIKGTERETWLQAVATDFSNVTVVSYLYNEDELPNTSESSREVSLLWSKVIATILPNIDIIFSSEMYGGFLADFLGIEHMCFDRERKNIPIAASTIIEHPLHNWDFISTVAKPYFVKKIILLGTESTGKSTLAKNLAKHFKTVYVPEMARKILKKTIDCKPEHLIAIADLHAKEIISQTKNANRLLFIDTDINITKSYSKYLFKQEIDVACWIEEANRADFYIFLEPDCPFIQDGTRLEDMERNELSLFHKVQLKQAGISYFSIYGNWEERFEKSCIAITHHFKINP